MSISRIMILKCILNEHPNILLHSLSMNWTLNSAHSPFPKAPKSKHQAKETKIERRKKMKGCINADLLQTNSSIKPHSPAKPGSMDRHNSWICEASDSRALKERFSTSRLNFNWNSLSCNSPVYHGQNLVLDVCRRRLGQQHVHPLHEDKEHLNRGYMMNDSKSTRS